MESCRYRVPVDDRLLCAAMTSDIVDGLECEFPNLSTKSCPLSLFSQGLIILESAERLYEALKNPSPISQKGARRVPIPISPVIKVVNIPQKRQV